MKVKELAANKQTSQLNNESKRVRPIPHELMIKIKPRHQHDTNEHKFQLLQNSTLEPLSLQL